MTLRLPGPARVTAFDWFVALNALLLVAMGWGHYARQPYGIALYGTVIVIGIAAGWLWLRRYEFPLWLLVYAQLGILANHAGELVRFGPQGLTLYQHVFLGIRFDKCVHVYNSAAIALALSVVIEGAGIRLGRAKGVMIVLMVVGIGAVHEVLEAVTNPFPRLTGGETPLANVAFDLLGDLIGALGASLIVGWWRRPSTRD